MTTKIAELLADLDVLDFNFIDVTVTCITSSRRYIYFRITVKAKRNGHEFVASYKNSNLNHQQTKGERWAAYYLPQVEGEISALVKSRAYRANSNIFRALRSVADQALAAG